MASLVESLNYEKGNWAFSTALTSCLKYYGFEINEPMIFGLSATFGFSYVKEGYGLPSRALYGINVDPEYYYSSNIKEKIEWRTEKYFPWENIKNSINEGKPVIALINPMSLPYEKTGALFSGQSLLILGYNETKGIVIVADNIQNSLNNITVDELAEAMNNIAPPLQRSNYWAPINKPEKIELETAVKRSVVRVAIDMLYPKQDENGIEGIRRFAGDITRWQTDIRDRKWSARQCQKAISNIDSDGANYRYSYSLFLREAEKVYPELADTDIADRMEYCGRLWQELGSCLEEYIETGDNRFLQHCSKLLIQIAKEEEGAFKDLLRLFTGKVYEKRVAAAAQ